MVRKNIAQSNHLEALEWIKETTKKLPNGKGKAKYLKKIIYFLLMKRKLWQRLRKRAEKTISSSFVNLPGNPVIKILIFYSDDSN